MGPQLNTDSKVMRLIWGLFDAMPMAGAVSHPAGALDSIIIDLAEHVLTDERLHLAVIRKGCLEYI